MSEKIAVIYKSKYGSAKRYAGWIGLRLNADLYEVKDIRNKDLKEYDTIIYGGGIYIGRINGIKFINKNYEIIKDKKIVIFTVGMEEISDELSERIMKSNIDEQLSEKIKMINLRGTFDYSQLNLIDKLLMKKVKLDIEEKSKRELTEADKIILQGFESLVDLCDKKSIDLLIENI